MIDQICKAYDSLDKEESNARSCATGIELVLNVLGVYIDGVNWDSTKQQEVIDNVENN
jgi:hypothetical protein